MKYSQNDPEYLSRPIASASSSIGANKGVLKKSNTPFVIAGLLRHVHLTIENKKLLQQDVISMEKTILKLT